MASTVCKSAGLMVMLMLAALVVSAQAGGREVMCENQLDKPCKCNGVEVLPGKKALVLLEADILAVVVVDLNGVPVLGKCKVPLGVTGVAVFVKVKAAVGVKAIVGVKVATVVGGILGLLGYLLGTILCFISVLL